MVVAVKPRSVSKRKALVSTIETRAETEGEREGREREEGNNVGEKNQSKNGRGRDGSEGGDGG